MQRKNKLQLEVEHADTVCHKLTFVLLMLQGWKRHGHSCYTVTSHEQSYEDARMGYYCTAPLLTVENRCFRQLMVVFYLWQHWSLAPHPLVSLMLAGLSRRSSTVC